MAKAASNNNRIVIGADHAGFALKKHLKEYLEGEGFAVTAAADAKEARAARQHLRFGRALAKARIIERARRCGFNVPVANNLCRRAASLSCTRI